MPPRTDQTVVVAGGTGNVGPFIVRELLRRGATVVVPSRSAEKLDDLRAHLGEHVAGRDLDRLHTFAVDYGDEAAIKALRGRIAARAGTPTAVVASVGDFVTTPSVLDASMDELRRALDGYLFAHFSLVRAFLPALRESGGTYLLMQGPLAFELHPEFEANLISIATAGQHMLFRALAQELDGGPVRVVELVGYTLIRDRQTVPGSPVTGETIAAYAAHLLHGAGGDVHGRSIHLRSPEQLAEIGLDTVGA